MLFQLSAHDYRVLLAHPERNQTFQRDHRRLAALVERGTLLQVTASALASTRRGSRSRRLAHDLVREGLAHVIASDAHGAHVPRPGLLAGVEAAERIAPAARPLDGHGRARGDRGRRAAAAAPAGAPLGTRAGGSPGAPERGCGSARALRHDRVLLGLERQTVGRLAGHRDRPRRAVAQERVRVSFAALDEPEAGGRRRDRRARRRRRSGREAPHRGERDDRDLARRHRAAPSARRAGSRRGTVRG